MKNSDDFFGASKRIPPKRKKALLEFCRPLGLHFKDLALLDLAFHHRSYSNEDSAYRHKNNERLEFLGDSVLGLVTATFLYKDLAENPEGDLAKMKGNVVSEKALAPVALEFGIDKMLVLGKGEESGGGRKKPAILADCMEAVIGAYYLDSGYEAAEKYVLRFIVPAVRSVQQDKGERDCKSLLQEAYQKKCKSIPHYELVKISGPDHDQAFFVAVHLGDAVYGPAQGKSKKQAEQNAARLALENWES